MGVNCPSCGSENVQRVTVAYEAGTTETHTAGRLRHSEGVAYHSTSGTSQTALAQRVSPPSKRSNTAAFLIALLGFFVAIVLPGLFRLVGLVAFIVCIFIAVKAAIWNTKTWPQLYREWQQKWVCHKCGDVFTVG